MRDGALCPDAQTLQEFVFGQLPFDQTEGLAQHLLQCNRCVETLGALQTEDPLLETVRAGFAPAEEPSQERLQRLIDRLRDLPGASDLLALPAPARGQSRESLHCVDTFAEGHTFLGPAQGPDEMGRLGPYSVIRVLGAGGMGIVFEARDPQLQRHVALKVLKPSLAASATARKRFLREGQAAAALQHDHIIGIHHIGEDRGVPFLAMQLLEGETLEQRLERSGRLPFTEALRIAREVAAGLAAAHAHDLFHRDIKPGNIWLEAGSGRVKILDFGLVQAADEDARLTRIGGYVGTPEYMAPEQADGKVADARCDLFSLGCVMYRTCTGEGPFQAPGPMAVLRALALRQPRSPHVLNPEVPTAFSALVMRLLSKEPTGRPASAQAVVETLAAISPQVARQSVAGSDLSLRGILSFRFLSSKGRWRLALGTIGTVVLGAVVLACCLLGVNTPDADSDHMAQAPLERPRQVLADRPRPFVLISARGGERANLASFGEAVTALHDGDTIEVHGNGPFTIGQVRLIGKGLSLRTAPGYRPQFVVKKWLGGRLVRLGPQQWGSSESVWLQSEGGSLRIEGCDFHGRPGIALFSSRGAACSLHNCRLLMDTQRWCYYSGPGLRITDCVIHAVIHVGPKAEVDLRNNVGRASIALQAGGGQTVRLHGNTLIPAGIGLLTLPPDLEALETVTVEAEKNLIGNGTFVLIPDVRSANVLKERLRWTGKDNLYEMAAPAIRDNRGYNHTQGLAEWNRFWGREENGSRQADHVFWQWDAPRLQSLDRAFRFLQSTTESLRRKALPASAQIGPKWNLVGPGDAYVRALAGQRKSGSGRVPDKLRPKPLPGGPFAIRRRGEAVRGYTTLQLAVAAVAAGDVIEIRGDGPFAGLERHDAKDGKDLLVRSAPGYLPVIEGDVVLSLQDTFSAEGLRFNGRIWDGTGHGRVGRIGRLASCAFDGPPDFSVIEASLAGGGGRRAEIDNCLVRPRFNLTMPAGGKLLLRNSLLVGGISLLLPEKSQSALEVEDCVIWHPTPHENIFEARDKGRVALSCRGTVFEAGSAMLNAERTGSWSGAHNIYCCGLRSWSNGSYLMGLDAWKERWHSSEEGSVEAEPLDYDPGQWRLLPSSPGYRLLGGKDFGADVSHVAVTR